MVCCCSLCKQLTLVVEVALLLVSYLLLQGRCAAQCIVQLLLQVCVLCQQLLER
jgi:hypothetical protein